MCPSIPTFLTRDSIVGYVRSFRKRHEISAVEDLARPRSATVLQPGVERNGGKSRLEKFWARLLERTNPSACCSILYPFGRNFFGTWRTPE
jgi:hypothetical protein